MRRFLIQAVIDALIAFVVVFALSLIHVNQPFPFGQESRPIVQPQGAGILSYLVWGAIFVVVNRIVRPILVALFGRLIFSTLGLFMIVITALAIALTSRFSPVEIALLADPTPLWLLLVASLFTAGSLVTDLALGLNRPHVGLPAGSSVWTILERLPTPRRNVIIENLRLQQVYEALYQTSIDIALEGTPIGSSRRWFEQHVLGETRLTEDESAPQRVGSLLQGLGPTYVKIGQMMASRSDILPPEWTTELARLQADADPFPWSEAREVIIAELKQTPEEAFGSIEPEPFAAASTAQVHRATLHDGTPVAVKIQRPQIVAKTKADLGVMQELAKTAESRFALARQMSIRAIVGEFAKGVLEELDYRNEAYHARRLADGMAKFERIHIPVVYEDLSASRVLTMEFVRGIKIADPQPILDAGLDPGELGATFMRAIIKQVMIDGFFHGDPHPGNVLVDPANGKIVFLDLGLVGQLQPEQRLDLLGLVYALKEVDISGIADSLIALGVPTKTFDEEAFRSTVDRLARQFLVYGEADSIGGALGGFLGAAFEHGLRLDSQLTLAVKAVVQAEETAVRLSYDLDLGQAAVEEAQAALLASLEPDAVMKQIQGRAIRIGKEFARRAPTLDTALLKWLDVVNQGKLVVQVDTSDLDRSIGKVGNAGRQATIGLIVVGQLIGTAIVMAILLQPSLSQYIGVAYAAMIAFGVTLVVSFWVLYRMAFNRDDDEPGAAVDATLPRVSDQRDVAYAGEPGAFAEDAVLAAFGDVGRRPVGSFRAVFEEVTAGRADAGMIPIENVIHGTVRENYDLLLEHELDIRGEVVVPVALCLAALPGQRLADIERVYSHIQALGQAETFLRSRPWQLLSTYNTAGAGKSIVDRDERGAAAVLSPRAAALFRLEVLADEIGDLEGNRTRFVVVARPDAPAPAMRADLRTVPRTTIAVAVRNEPGTLLAVLRVIADHGLNMRKLESRPLRDRPWEYVFWIDLDGGLVDAPAGAPMREAIEEVRGVTTMTRVLGSYPSEDA